MIYNNKNFKFITTNFLLLADFFLCKKKCAVYILQKILKQKLSAGTVLIILSLFVFAIFSNLVKLELHIYQLLFNDVNLTRHFSKIPDIFFNFLTTLNCHLL